MTWRVTILTKRPKATRLTRLPKDSLTANVHVPLYLVLVNALYPTLACSKQLFRQIAGAISQQKLDPEISKDRYQCVLKRIIPQFCPS
jgi:hypothetical protein